MKRVGNILVGLILLPFGAFFIVAGTFRVFHAAMAMADGRLEGTQASEALLALLIGLLWVAPGYWAGSSGWNRLKRGIWPVAEAPATPPIAATVPEPAAIVPALRAARPESARTLAAVLTLDHKGQVALLTADSGEAVLGRGSECRVIVNSKHVSRAHARIVWDPTGAPCLVNLGQLGTSVCAKGESHYRPCDPQLRLEGEGTIALSSDGADAASRGDVVSFAVG